MLRLPYLPEAFPYYLEATFGWPFEFEFTWEELCRAAVTVGRRSWVDVLKHGTYSVFEAMWRIAIVRANLVEEPDGRLSRSDAFRNLDPSEKSAVSYFLGLTLTKLIAEKMFGIAWLLHLDTYKSEINAQTTLPQRPDFVGLDPHYAWLVIESKGRTGSVSNELMAAAKKQTRSLRNINGQFPAMRVGVGTYFSGGKLRARIRDPEGHDDDATDVEISPEKLARAYYRPIVEILEQLGRDLVDDQGLKVREAELPGFDVTLRVDSDVIAWYRGLLAWEAIVERRRADPSLLSEVARIRHQSEDDLTAIRRLEPVAGVDRLRAVRRIGRDGIEVALGDSWSPQFMRLQPPDRGI
jgi:hypothetical protein